MNGRICLCGPNPCAAIRDAIDLDEEASDEVLGKSIAIVVSAIASEGMSAVEIVASSLLLEGTPNSASLAPGHLPKFKA